MLTGMVKFIDITFVFQYKPLFTPWQCLAQRLVGPSKQGSETNNST